MKLGISSHKLLIETGRYDHIPVMNFIYFIFLRPSSNVDLFMYVTNTCNILAPWVYPNDISSTVDSDV